MRKILSIAWNDILVEFSTPVTLVFFLILPLVFTSIIGAGLDNSYGDGDEDADNRFVFLVANEDDSALATQLVTRLESSEVVRPVLHEREEAERLFKENSVPGLLIIPDDFGSALRKGEPTTLSFRSSPDDNRSLAVQREIQAAVSQVSGAVIAAHVSVEEAEQMAAFDSESARGDYFEQGIAMAEEVLASTTVQSEVTVPPESNRQIATGFEQSSAGQLVTWVLITLVGAAEVFVNERLGGTLRRMLSTPTEKAKILVGKIAARFGMGLVQMALLIGFGTVVLNVDWGRSLPALILVMVSFGLAAVSYGVLLATFAKTRGQASGLTVLSSMLMAALGGAWWPLEITPATYQAVVKVLPSTWAMIGFNDVIVRGQDIVGVLPEAGVLLSFATLFFAVGVIRFRYE